MQTITLSYDEALEALHKAVEDRGADYQYNEHYSFCRNFDAEGKPMCIVGHVLDQKGADEEFRQEHKGGSVNALTYDGVLVIDHRTKVLLTAAQIAQDDYRCWGDAVKEAVQAVVDYDHRAARLAEMAGKK